LRREGRRKEGREGRKSWVNAQHILWSKGASLVRTSKQKLLPVSLLPSVPPSLSPSFLTLPPTSTIVGCPFRSICEREEDDEEEEEEEEGEEEKEEEEGFEEEEEEEEEAAEANAAEAEATA